MVALLRVWDRPERIVPKWTLLVVVVVVVNVQMLEVGRPLPLTFPGGGIGQNSNQILIYETLWNVPDSEPWGYAGLLLHFHITRLRFIIALLPWWKSQLLGGIPQFMLLSKLASGLSLRRRRWVKEGARAALNYSQIFVALSLPFGYRISKHILPQGQIFIHLTATWTPINPSYCFKLLCILSLRAAARTSNGHEKRQTISSNLVALPPCHTPAIEIITHFIIHCCSRKLELEKLLLLLLLQNF